MVFTFGSVYKRGGDFDGETVYKRARDFFGETKGG